MLRRSWQLPLEPACELTGQRCLPHAGIAEDRHDMWLAALEDTTVGRAEELELWLATDERAAETGQAEGTLASNSFLQRSGEEPLSVATALELTTRAEHEEGPRQCDRPLADECLAGGSRVREGRRDVQRGADDRRPSDASVIDDDLARVNADAHPSPCSLGGERRQQRPHRVVFLRGECAERCDDPVARALHHSAESFELARERRSKPIGQLAEALRVLEGTVCAWLGGEHRDDPPTRRPTPRPLDCGRAQPRVLREDGALELLQLASRLSARTPRPVCVARHGRSRGHPSAARHGRAQASVARAPVRERAPPRPASRAPGRARHRGRAPAQR